MQTQPPNFKVAATLLAPFAIVLALASTLCGEQQVRLRSGFVMRGSVLEIASINQNPFAGTAGSEVQVLPIWLIDDGLRRCYVHKLGMIAEVTPIEGVRNRIEFWQPVAPGNRTIAGIGPLLAVSPFNSYGQRIVEVRQTDAARISIIQGITEINARYAKVEGLKSTPSYAWDMRVATDSIDSEQLRQVFRQRIDQSNYDRRLEIVRFYIEAELFGEARDEVERLMKDFPDEASLTAQLQSLVQRQWTQLFDEAKLRRDAGQYELAKSVLQNFPVNEVAGATRLEVQDTIDSIDAKIAEGRRLIEQLTAQLETLGDGDRKQTLLTLVEEISAGLSLDTLARLSDYGRLGGVENVPVDNRISLAIGGWLLGSGSGLQNIAIATSLVEVRKLVAKYLASSDADERKAILAELRKLEGADPNFVSKMLPLLPPPLALPEEAKHESIAGMYLIDEKVRGVLGGDYILQLPPEYNPLRSYPCVVALHPVGGSAEAQLDYWSGPPATDGQSRLGQGARHGFVVIAPRWTRTGQSGYESTAREHAEVLTAVRDAMRRVSIDSDRVFLAGLGNGGSAAWDIAVSHPDIWAGMICVSGEANQYLRHYNRNAKSIPMYLVFGEIAGDKAPLLRNGDVLDDYMAPGFDAIVVMYRGRGPEPFYEEIHNLFDWMQLATHRRRDPPQRIEASSMRHGDQFFWWLEMTKIMDNIAIDPLLWDQTPHPRAAEVVASIGEGNVVRVTQGPADQFILYFSPEMGLKMDQPIIIRYRSRRIDFQFDGSLDTMLEDARTRGDRKHPYWGSLIVP